MSARRIALTGASRQVAATSTARWRVPGVEHLGGALVGQQLVLGHVDRKGRYARSVLRRGLNPCRKHAALRAPTGTGSADNAVLDDLTLDHHLDHLVSYREHRSSDLGAAASAGAGPRQRDDHAPIGVINQGVSDAGWPGCPLGLRPLGWRCERSGGFLNGESEGSGRLELWLSLVRRASNSRMRSRKCSMSAVCSATHSRNRLSSSSGFAGAWVRVGYSGIGIDYVCSLTAWQEVLGGVQESEGA